MTSISLNAYYFLRVEAFLTFALLTDLRQV